ncbi:ATP-binding protein [Geobacter sp. FeAm09]|uniref:HD domain-containing protein n=1 Tax=Geobacter sp. FeAm09 TaxID=2597769 RepID=UPI0011ED3269|nr:ATP-binding protein [Geobacter sp. FeAm09]QEM68612.1 ATP-binding protein [Geobacter sp. FeAm09]
MAGRLMQHLREKSKEHPHLNLLLSQWNFDEELIPKALQNVAAIFPHYSRHDASHSRQILINIERILGDTLETLTTTDTWLLLESAYWHDIGMVITSKDITDDMQSFEFKQYVTDIASQNGHELQLFAKKFSSFDVQNCFSAADTPHQAVDLYRQLLAGWYRVRHPKRAAEIVGDPWLKAGIASPRNELVPMRLFRLIGQICRSHGSSFDSIVESLPHCETGMATEDCHPRFVACLLRLGDLFDLDDNRFCPVMLRIAGEIPPSSQAHIDKHAAIRHFRLDPDRVEITAECPNYESYEATDLWFRWIEDELRCQMTHWKDIVPNRQFGLLPTLGKLEVNLTPPHEVLDPGQRPRFGVDPQKTIELLQGAGLYRDSLQSLRELLQNAVDATLIRIWLTHGENSDSTDKSIDWQDPISPAVRELFSRYPIEVNLFKTNEAEGGRVTWQLDIRDRGIGISKQDLKFMKSVGASSKNPDRKAIISKMPKWMCPSGAFGIGLQSAFLISHEIQFETKSLFTGDALKIKMTSPIGPQRGLIYLQSSTHLPGRESGTLLSIAINTEAIPKRYSMNFEDNVTSYILSDFDPILMSDLPCEPARMVDEILRFSALSPINLIIKFGEQLLNTNKTSTEEPPRYFSLETGVMLIDPKFIINRQFRTWLAFRGQKIEKWHAEIPFVLFQADILAELAPDTLTVNRNEVKDSAYEHIYKILIETITSYLCNIDLQNLSDVEKHAASAFLFWHDKISARPELVETWRNMTLNEVGSTINEICNLDNFKFYLREMNSNVNDMEPPEGGLVIDTTEISSPRYKLLFRLWNEQKGNIQIEFTPEWKGATLIFSKQALPPIGTNYLRSVLLDAIKQRMRGVGGRRALPVWDEFSKLAANIEKLDWCHSLSDVHPFHEHFVLPFFFDKNQKKVTTDGLDELCAWTFKYSCSHNVTEEEIKSLYGSFIKLIDETVMDGIPEWKTMRT